MFADGSLSISSSGITRWARFERLPPGTADGLGLSIVRVPYSPCLAVGRLSVVTVETKAQLSGVEAALIDPIVGPGFRLQALPQFDVAHCAGVLPLDEEKTLAVVAVTEQPVVSTVVDEVQVVPTVVMPSVVMVEMKQSEVTCAATEAEHEPLLEDVSVVDDELYEDGSSGDWLSED